MYWIVSCIIRMLWDICRFEFVELKTLYIKIYMRMFSIASNKNDVRKRWSYEHIIKHKIMAICTEKEENNIFNETNERVTNKKKELWFIRCRWWCWCFIVKVRWLLSWFAIDSVVVSIAALFIFILSLLWLFIRDL